MVDHEGAHFSSFERKCSPHGCDFCIFAEDPVTYGLYEGTGLGKMLRIGSAKIGASKRKIRPDDPDESPVGTANIARK